MCEGPGHEATLIFSLIPKKPLCGRGLDMSHVSKVRVRCFLRREKRNTLRMRKQCVPGPLSALWEGPGYEARKKYAARKVNLSMGETNTSE